MKRKIHKNHIATIEEYLQDRCFSVKESHLGSERDVLVKNIHNQVKEKSVFSIDGDENIVNYKNDIKNTDVISDDSKSSEKDKSVTKTVAGYHVTKNVRSNAEALGLKYKKPKNYTGNRYQYDDGAAKHKIKRNTFAKNKEVNDPYTNKKLTLTKKEAKRIYGDEWQDHVAEVDHKVPIKNVHEQVKDNPWIELNDAKKIVNHEDNMEVTSRKYNNAKRSRKTEDFVNDDEYLERTGVKITKSGKEKAVQNGKDAQSKINWKIRITTCKNILNEGHKAGKVIAVPAGLATLVTSGITNVVDVISGKKAPEQALKEAALDTSKAAATAYVTGGALTVLSHTLSSSSSRFLQALGKSNIPAQVITTVMVTGNTITQYMRGEITTEDCILELGDKGLTLATAGYSALIGQTVIPIPIVGATVGALVGSMLTSQLYQSLISSLRQDKVEHKERMRIIADCEELTRQYQQYQNELEMNLQIYFRDYTDCFNEALGEMHKALDAGDADRIIVNANKITKKLGGTVKYGSMEEFENYLNDDTLDVL